MNNETDDSNPPPPEDPAQPAETAARPTAGGSGADPGDAVGYDGEAGKLFGLGLKIGILTLITAGFYRFWGKTEIRRYLWSRVSMMNDRFEYTGTGKELFLGFLIALLVLIPLGIAVFAIELLLTGESLVLYTVAMIAQYGLILFLIGFATYRARRYRLSRTVLRGIRFWQTGSSAGYALRWMGYLALTVITLGIARPVGDVGLYRFLMENTWFGSRNFGTNAATGGLLGPWVLCLVLAPFTLGLSLLWYAAFKMRYLAGSTRYQGLTLSLPVTFGDLLRVYLPYLLVVLAVLALYFVTIFAAMIPVFLGGEQVDTNIQTAMSANVIGALAAVVIFGLIMPILNLVLLTHRMTGLFARRLAFEGSVDLDSVMQAAAERPKHGEGLADALDIGGGLEIGL